MRPSASETTTRPQTETVPPRPSGHDHHGWLASAGFVALIVWSYRGTGMDLGQIVGPEGLRQIAAYVGGLFPPDLSWTTLRDAGIGAVETFAISLVGSLLAVGIAVPLALLISAGAKALLSLLRTIPEILWALIFVFMVGLGPFPGVLALAFHTGGVLGKLFGEVIEDVDPRPLEALQATGAGRLRIMLYGIFPQAAPQFVSYALYRWEVNIRAAAVLGFVGAGGLGQRIYVTINLFLEHQLLTLIIAIYAMVTLVDALSAYLRRRLV